jgi:MFS family permease
MLAFFVAFNVLGRCCSLVSRIAPAHARGAAIGAYNTTQTLGLFFGGLAGGWLAKHFGNGVLFASCAVLTVVWLGIAAGMRAPARAGAVNGLADFALGGKQRT